MPVHVVRIRVGESRAHRIKVGCVSRSFPPDSLCRLVLATALGIGHSRPAWPAAQRTNPNRAARVSNRLIPVDFGEASRSLVSALCSGCQDPR